MSKSKKTGLNRYGTIQHFFENEIDAVRKHKINGVHGGPHAALAYCAMWAECYGKTGKIAMTVSLLARTICCNRKTAARSLDVLWKLELITPAVEPEPGQRPTVWYVKHLSYDESESP